MVSRVTKFLWVVASSCTVKVLACFLGIFHVCFGPKCLKNYMRSRREKTEEKVHKSMSCPLVFHVTIASDFPSWLPPLNVSPGVSHVSRVVMTRRAHLKMQAQAQLLGILDL